MTTEPTRYCARCEEDLPVGDFNISRVHTRTDGHEKQSWCKQCFREYYADYHREIPNPAAGDGKPYVSVGQIEYDPDFERNDAMRRARLVKPLLVLTLMMVGCASTPKTSVVACWVECHSPTSLTETQRRVGDEGITCSGNDVSVHVVCR